VIELEGTYDIQAPPDLVWEMVRDPEVLAMVVPGCEKLELVDENKFRGRMRIMIGPVDGVFQGTVTLSDLQSLAGYHFVVDGRGPSGMMRGEGDLSLEATDTGTLLGYEGSGQVSGRIATVGQRLMTSSGRAIAKQCLQNLDKQIQARVEPQPTTEDTPGTADPAVAPTPAAPSQSEFFMAVAQEMVDEYLPGRRERALLASVVLLPIFCGLINLFANLVARRVVKLLKEEASD